MHRYCRTYLKLFLLSQIFLPQFAQATDWAELPAFKNGVQAYREGHFLEAEQLFQPLHREHPEASGVTYYLAITEAQLGRFKQAKALYGEILTLDPNSEEAKLATEGLSYLPEETSLDHPPRFQVPTGALAKSPADNTHSLAAQTGMSPQDIMAWQMMMAQMGGNQQNGANPWAYMTMPQATGTPNTAPQIDPNVMSNLLMNQMMQNFSLDGGKPEN